MKKAIIKGLVLLGYCAPYSFLAMNSDANSGTMLFYGIMAVSLSILCFIAHKYHAISYAIGGSVLSVIISHICILSFMTEKWLWYFKPFTPTTLSIIISVVALLIQLTIWIVFKKKLKK